MLCLAGLYCQYRQQHARPQLLRPLTAPAHARIGQVRVVFEGHLDGESQAAELLGDPVGGHGLVGCAFWRLAVAMLGLKVGAGG